MANKTLIIGLTGGIGSGKTAASDYFQSLGIKVVDADIEARAIVEPGSDILTTIYHHFGSSVLTDTGELNRGWLRQQIFQSPEERLWLESLTHPAIRERIRLQLSTADSPYVILVSPLLFESGQHLMTDRTLLIDLPEALQRTRASLRDNNTQEQIDAIIQAQMSRQERQERADDIIINDQDLKDLQQECLNYHQNYLKLAQKPDAKDRL